MIKTFESRKRPVYEYFTIGGRPSLDFGIYLGECGDLDKRAERDQTSHAIIGRDGDLTVDNGRYKNVSGVISCHIVNGYEQYLSAFADYLASNRGYFRMEDTFHPGEYTMTKFPAGIDPETVTHNSGVFDLAFDRMPQRFLKAGEVPAPLASAASVILRNPTRETARPLIQMTGRSTGGVTQNISISFTSGGVARVLTIAPAAGQIVVDCEKMTVTQDGTNKLPDCRFNEALQQAGYFPLLYAGNNTVYITGADSVQLTPRWWRR